MKQTAWDRRRMIIFNLWKMQLLSREATMGERLGNFTFAVTMRGTPYIAHVLVNSFDYYERRLHLRRDERPITLLICQKHDTCVPIHVEPLDEPTYYEPYQLPATYAQAQRRTNLEAHVLLGQLLSYTVNHEEALAHFAPSTRAAYLARIRALRKKKRGRSPSL